MTPLSDKEVDELSAVNWDAFHLPLCPDNIGDGECKCTASLMPRALKRIMQDRLVLQPRYTDSRGPEMNRF